MYLNEEEFLNWLIGDMTATEILEAAVEFEQRMLEHFELYKGTDLGTDLESWFETLQYWIDRGVEAEQHETHQ